MKQTLNVCIHKNIHKNNLHKHIQSNNIVQFNLYRILRYFLYFVFLEKLVLEKTWYSLVSTVSNRYLLPTVQRLCQGNLIYFHQLPISFRQNAMTNTARGKDRVNVFKCLSQTVTHLVYIIPLLLSHRCTHVIRRHLRLIKQPLEDEQRRYEFENEK